MKMTKEIMINKVKALCKAEGITTVKSFRDFFEYWIIGHGEMDDDFSFAAKRIEKSVTFAQWKKGYAMLSDEDISLCLATPEEKELSNEQWKEEQKIREEKENSKTEEEKKAEIETELEMRDAGLNYNINKTWEENVKLNANNPALKIEEIKKYSGYGYHGGGRPRKDTEARRRTVSISGTPQEISELKSLAETEDKTVSDFVLKKIGVRKK